MRKLVSHIPKFVDTNKSPAGDAVVSRGRCIISFRDAHPPHSHPHLQIAGYVTLLRKEENLNQLHVLIGASNDV